MYNNYRNNLSNSNTYNQPNTQFNEQFGQNQQSQQPMQPQQSQNNQFVSLMDEDEFFRLSYIRLMNSFISNNQNILYLYSMFERNLRRFYNNNNNNNMNNDFNGNINFNTYAENFFDRTINNLSQNPLQNPFQNPFQNPSYNERNNRNQERNTQRQERQHQHSQHSQQQRTQHQAQEIPNPTRLRNLQSYLFVEPIILTSNANASQRNNHLQSTLTNDNISEITELINFNGIVNPINTECPITREQFNNDSIVMRIKSCGHCFSPYNLLSWFRYNSTCPLCRHNVFNDLRSSNNNVDLSNNNVDSSNNRINSNINTSNSRSNEENNSRRNNRSLIDILNSSQPIISSNILDPSGNVTNTIQNFLNTINQTLINPISLDLSNNNILSGITQQNSSQTTLQNTVPEISDVNFREIYNTLINNSSVLQNLSIDNIDNNGIIFSYDVPIYSTAESMLSSSLSSFFNPTTNSNESINQTNNQAENVDLSGNNTSNQRSNLSNNSRTNLYDID
jgi:hypothetical protein